MTTKYLNLDTDSSFSANSDYIIPSQKAVKSAIDKKADISSLSKVATTNEYTDLNNIPKFNVNSIKKDTNSQYQTIGTVETNKNLIIKNWVGTRAEYDALTTKDDNTLYSITDEAESLIVNTYTQAEIDYLLNTKYNIIEADAKFATKTENNTKVAKAGDTMTGNLVIKTNADTISHYATHFTDHMTTPTSAAYSGMTFYDNKGQRYGKVEGFWLTDGTSKFGINHGRSINGTMQYAQLNLWVDTAGGINMSFPKCTAKATTTSSATANRVAVITQNYKSGNNWYRVWSDGWIEQGGVTAAWYRGSLNTLTFLKAFTQKPTFICNLEVTNGEASEMRAVVGNQNNNAGVTFVTTSQVTLYIHGMSGSGTDGGPVHWYACGY